MCPRFLCNIHFPLSVSLKFVLHNRRILFRKISFKEFQVCFKTPEVDHKRSLPTILLAIVLFIAINRVLSKILFKIVFNIFFLMFRRQIRTYIWVECKSITGIDSFLKIRGWGTCVPILESS